MVANKFSRFVIFMAIIMVLIVGMAGKYSTDTAGLATSDASLRMQYARGVWDFCVIMGIQIGVPDLEVMRVCAGVIEQSEKNKWYDSESPGFLYPPLGLSG